MHILQPNTYSIYFIFLINILIAYTFFHYHTIQIQYMQIDPVLIDTGFKATHMKWNPNGTVLAIAGSKSVTIYSSSSSNNSVEQQMHQVQFYNPEGKVRINCFRWINDSSTHTYDIYNLSLSSILIIFLTASELIESSWRRIDRNVMGSEWFTIGISSWQLYFLCQHLS